MNTRVQFSTSDLKNGNHSSRLKGRGHLLLFLLLFFTVGGWIQSTKVKAQSIPCILLCKDTTICFELADSLVKLPKPSYKVPGAGISNGDCPYDSMWNNSPGVYPVGITYVTWFVSYPPSRVDSCTAKVTRKPPGTYTISFATMPPIVAGVINICNGQSITFYDNSVGTTGRLWNFGNGFYSTNATHTEPAWHYPPGTYFDTLTIFDDCGNPHDTAFQVVVDSASGPDIECISVVCPGDTVTYHTNANCTGYTWSVTGGTFLNPPQPTDDSVTVVWGAGPTGTISLSVTGCTPAINCPNPTIKEVSIVPATLPIIGDTIVCAGSTSTYCVECIAGNNYSWELLPANAGTVTGQGTCCLTINWTPGFTGTVTLLLNYQNVLTGSGCNLPETCNADPGCGGTASITIHVLPIFGISGPTKVCVNSVAAPFTGMNLTTNTPVPGTTWKVKTPVPSTLLFANTAALNAYTWNAGPGIYQLTAIAPPGIYCNDSASVTITAIDVIAPDSISGPDTVCAGTPQIYSVIPNTTGVTYNWTVSNGTIIGPANGNSITVQWNPGGGTVSVTQSLTASPFCTSPPSPVHATVTWPNFSLPVVTAGSAIACVKSTIVYSIPLPLLSNATYTWSVVPSTAGNIVSANGTNQISIRWIDASAGPIFVKLKINRCYSDSVMFPVNLLGLPPVPPITAPANACTGQSVSFSTTSPGPVWNWNFGDGGTAVTQNATNTYSLPGTYNVFLAVTNVNGCTDTAFTKIKIDGSPQTPVITGPSSVCAGSTVTYSFSQPIFNGANYVWSVTPQGVIQAGQGTSAITVKWNTTTLAGQVSLTVLSTCPSPPVVPLNVVVNANPVASISVPSPLCVGAPLTFTGSGGTTYNWNFPGASSVNLSNPSAPVVTYSSSTNYQASLNIVDVNGCTASANANFTINPLPLVNPTYTPVCQWPQSVTVSTVATAGYSYLWNTGATTSNFTVTLNANTNYSVVVTNSFGCTSSSTLFVQDGTCNPMPGLCPVNDSIDFTHTPPVCLTKTFTKTLTATHTGWNFGVGSAGAVSPVTFTFPTPGIYNVAVMGLAVGMDGSGQMCTTIVMMNKPIIIPFDVQFNVNYQCNGLGQMQTVISNTSLYYGNINSYTWNWYLDGNAIPFSTSAFPSNQLFSAGPHNILCVASDPGGTLGVCSLNVSINVPVPVSAAMNIPPGPYCAGVPINFSDASTNSPTSWLWDFYNNGISTSGQQNPTFTYPAAGTFTVRLTAGDQYGCSSTVTSPITIQSGGSGTITVNNTFCDSIQLTASGIGPFTWSNVAMQPVPDNPFYVKQNGYYSVQGYNPSFGCPYTATVGPLTVKNSPDATISGTTQYCQGENLDLKTNTAGVTVAWTPYPGGPVLGTNPNLTIPANIPGTFTYQVTLTAPNGCTATDTITVTVDPVPSSPVITASGPLTFCEGDSVMLSVSPPGNNYLWSKSPTPPLSAPQNTNANLWVTQSGTYSVIVQTSNGCAYPNIAPVTITVNPSPVAQITGDTVVCEKKTLTLTATILAGATYNWFGPFGTSNTNPFVKPNMQLADAGPYGVTVTNTFGCSSTTIVNVQVDPAPLPPFISSNPAPPVCEGQMYNLFVVGPLGPPNTYEWNTGQLGSSINAYLKGDYSVTITNIFGCTANSNTITIHPMPDLSCAPAGCYEFCNDCDTVMIPGPDGLFQYEWQQLVGNVFMFYSNTQNLTVLPPGGVFQLVGTTQFGCADTTDSLKIDFKDCCPPFVPTCLDTCVNFDDQLTHGWQPDPNAPSVGILVTNAGSQNGPGDYFLQATEIANPSGVIAGPELTGLWCCGEFCYDYRIFDDAKPNVTNVNPQFSIFNGTLGFQFTSNTIVNENSGWHRICAPIGDCGMPDSSGAGAWSPIGPTVPGDWTTVISNVTSVSFPTSFSTGNGEISGFDDACITNEVPQINAGADTTVCAGTVISLTVTGCISIPKWYTIVGDSLIYVGDGPVVDLTPAQSACYVAICCGAGPCCCDSDTVCITVNPLPKLQWDLQDTVCQNAPPVFLDSSNVLVLVNNNWIPVSQAGGSGVFTGVGVVGNQFFPNSLGPHIITYTYTDSSGCTASVSDTIDVVQCFTCDTTCQVSAGPDQVICIGQPVILSVTGCNDTADWYELTPMGLQPVGSGPDLELFPLGNTCYVVICCNPTPCCCDTDTVCITVKPLPILQWNLPDSVCLNAPSIFLDSSTVSVFINNSWVPVPMAGGTGYFSGPNVVGNYFIPNTLGSFTITYTYLDTNGCTGTVTDVINVVNCNNCDTSCQISAGPDQIICAGEPAILNVTGCNGNATWYQLEQDTMILVGNGPIFDIFPQVSGCYVVICCNPTPCCCDTDTVCITVKPLPILQWNLPDSVCLNAPSIFLDSSTVSVFINNSWVPVPMAGGTGYFSGPNVVGNYFIPNTLGSFTITYTYLDTNGCTGTVTDVINVVNCNNCDTSCQISAGPDQIICAGEPAILNVTGCNGNATWYQLEQDTMILVGNGPIFDIFPQVSGCYVVICCNPTPCCCDTDTVCITVKPHPVLQWPINFSTLCLNSGPVYLDSSLIQVFDGNAWVSIAVYGGSGFFNGPGVVGNYFYPNTLGSNYITYYYTAPNGCNTSVSQSIEVINCGNGCGPGCAISAGPDQNICAGDPAILQVTNCNSTPNWYQIVEGSLQPVGTGPILDIFPQSSACFVVICCNPVPCCCDTDTVCINVGQPPMITWGRRSLTVCLTSPPVYLDVNDISVFNGFVWVPVSLAGGSGYFTGPGVSGNYFTPPGIGTYVVTYVYTAPNGCTVYVSRTIRVINCRRIIFNTELFIQGYYSGNGTMDNDGHGGALYLSGVPGSTFADADTVVISVVEPVSGITVDTQYGILDVDGHVTVSFDTVVQESAAYYVKVNHRNTLETWSSVPVVMDSVTTYSFTDSQTSAYGSNLKDLGDGHFALYSGDVDQNGIIETTDQDLIGYSAEAFQVGYDASDITGDGVVESADQSMVENNLGMLLFHP